MIKIIAFMCSILIPWGCSMTPILAHPVHESCEDHALDNGFYYCNKLFRGSRAHHDCRAGVIRSFEASLEEKELNDQLCHPTYVRACKTGVVIFKNKLNDCKKRED